MKNFIKIIVTLGIVTSFFPMYSMENRPEGELYYSIKMKDLKTINPLTDMSKLAIYQGFSQNTNSVSISGDDPLLTDEDLALRLAVMKVLAESDSEENNKILEAIGIAVGRGMPIISKHFLSYGDSGISLVCGLSGAKPESLFTNINQHARKVLKSKSRISAQIEGEWSKMGGDVFRLKTQSESAQPFPLFLLSQKEEEWELAYKAGEAIVYGEMVGNKTIRQLMNTIFEGEDERQKRLTYTLNALNSCTSDELKINIPEDLMFLIVSFIQKHRKEEGTVLIEKVRRKFLAYSG